MAETIAAVVLAAGNSRRMGRPKALLEYRGKLFIENICASLRAAGVERRIVVLGRDASAITSAWKPSDEEVVVNPDPDLGQLSSLRAGLAAIPSGSGGFMVCLVDQPTILPETYSSIINFWRLSSGAIVIPRCLRGLLPASHPAATGPAAADRPFKRGHPIIIPAAYRQLCFDGPLDNGLHWVTHHPSVKVLDLEVADSGIVMDFDTPQQYEGLRGGGVEG